MLLLTTTTVFLLALTSIVSFHVRPSQTLKTIHILQSNRDNNEGYTSLHSKVKSKLFDIPLKTMAISLGAFLTTKQVSAVVSDNDLEVITNKGRFCEMIMII